MTESSSEVQQLQEQVDKYREGYDQANELCSQLMEMSQDLQVQLEEAKAHTRQEVLHALEQERNKFRTILAQQLQEVQDQAHSDQAALTATLREQHRQELSQKDQQIEQLTGQLNRLFNHYTGDSPADTDSAPAPSAPAESSQADSEQVQKLQEKIQELEKKWEAENKRAVDLEMKYQLLERIKNALKSSTDQSRKELQAKIFELEKQLRETAASAPAPSPATPPPDLVEQNQTLQQTVTSLQEELARARVALQEQTSQQQAHQAEETQRWEQKLAQLQDALDVERRGKTSAAAPSRSGGDEATASLALLRDETNQLKASLHETHSQLEAAQATSRNQLILLKEKDSSISQLNHRVNDLTAKLTEQQRLVARLQETAAATRDHPVMPSSEERSSEHEQVLELQMALQGHQSTISDLQAQCSALRKEILERNEAHESKLRALESQKRAAEGQVQSILQSHALKVQSYEQNYQDIEDQLDLVHSQVEQLSSVREELAFAQEELAAVRGQLQLAEKEVNTLKDLLYEERRNLEVSKEISCDLQKHILELSQAHKATQQQYKDLMSSYEQLQLEATQQRNAFEQEKAAIVYDLLHKQMHSERTAGSPTPTSPTFGGPHSNGQRHDEKRSLSVVKSNLIDEMWRESWNMAHTPSSVRVRSPSASDSSVSH